MRSEKFKITEWMAIITLAIGLYCYLYNYLYWDYFGVNAYDYFSYSDSLQRSVPLLLMTVTLINFIVFILLSLLICVKKSTLKLFRMIKRINKGGSSGYYFVMSLVALAVFVSSSRLIMPILKMEGLSYNDKRIIIGVFFVLSLSLCSSSISLFSFMHSVEKKNKSKVSIFCFFISPVPFQILLSIFYMPTMNAYRDENTIQAQVITKEQGKISSHKMLALTKDYVFIIDDKNVVVKKSSDIDYIYYRVDKIK